MEKLDKWQISDSIKELKEINRNGRTIKNTGKTVVGRGLALENLQKEIDVTINDADRSGHFGCFGTTRIGKTRLLEGIIEQDIKKGYNVVVIDPKGDIELFSKIVQVAAEAGRLDDLMYLSPIFPDISSILDPLCHFYMQEELVDHIVSGMKVKEDYFIAIGTDVSQSLVAGLDLQAKHAGKKLNINFEDIKKRSDYESLTQFREEIRDIPGSDDIVSGLNQILSSPADFFGKVSSSFRTTLSALTTGNTGKIIGKSTENEMIKRFEQGKGVIMFCNTGSMLARRTAHINGRVLVSMIQSLVGRFFASGRKLDPPLCLHLDEGHNVLYSGIHELFTKAGGANVWVHFYTQSIANIEEEIGREGAKSILDNINSWIYMLVNHPETAKYVEDSSPMSKMMAPMVNMSTGVTLRDAEEKSILGHKIMEMQKRQFYMRTYGRVFKGITKDSTESYVEIPFPKIKA